MKFQTSKLQENIANIGSALTSVVGEDYGSFSVTDTNTLRFAPNDPDNIDYDFKFIKNTFGSAISGVGTTSIGFINLTGFSGETYDDAIFTWNGENGVKVSILPQHNLRDKEYVTISGFSSDLSKLNNNFQIGISSFYSNLSSPR